MRITKGTFVWLALLSAFLLWRPATPVDIHAEVQQRLLEAEFGSAMAFHFAGSPREQLPDNTSAGLLYKQLQAPQAETRWKAAKQFAARHDTRAVEAVIRAMRDPAGTRRVCVMASTLGRLKDPRALSALTEAAFDPGNRDLRLCAIQSLGMIGDTRAVPVLIEALRTGNNPITAANAIARMGDVRGVDPMIEAAGVPQQRLWMVRALGELGNVQAIPYLSSLADDPKASIRLAAIEARWKIDQLSASDVVMALSNVLEKETSDARRMWVAFRLGERHEVGAVPALVKALNDPERDVRGRAAAALIRVGKPVNPAMKPLALQTRQPASVYAVAILGYTGGNDEITFLRSLTDKAGDDRQLAVASDSIELIKRFDLPQDNVGEFAALE